MKINAATLDLVKRWEGFSATAYPDPATGGDPITIGYGTTARAGVGIEPKMGMTITQAQAEKYLVRGLKKFAAQILPLIRRPVNENQFGAMLSLAYNIGPTAFSRSTLLRKFNEGDVQGAANEFPRWNKANGKVMRGLKLRREDERELFLTPAPKPSIWQIIIELIARIFK